jgi:very-short-patch-repair endonuclease
MPRIPLPPDLRGSAIRTSTSADHGLTRSRLRGSDVQHPFHAVSAIDLDLTAVRGRCLALLPAMVAGQVFSHTTALALHGVPLPGLPPGIHVSVAFPRTPPRRPGVHGHSLVRVPATLIDGMPVSVAAEAWAQSAALLDRDDLVAAGDHLLQSGEAAALAAVAAQWRGRPGGHRLRWAAERVRPGVRSRPETHLRLLLLRSRLPEPVVGHPVPVSGGLVLHPDLAFPSRRLALEYEGFDHFVSRRVVERDIERRELLAEAGWRTLRVTAGQLYDDPGRLLGRIRRHLAAGDTSIRASWRFGTAEPPTRTNRRG